VADLLISTLGQQNIARGMMFDGATLSDPRFSPAALRSKYLVMAEQAEIRPFLGFVVADMLRGGLGVKVTDVPEGTPAAKAGMHKDDWITRVNGNAIEDKKSLKKQLSQVTVGNQLIVSKENLEETKIVVGGAIESDDKVHQLAKKLGSLVFLATNNGADLNEGDSPWHAKTMRAEDFLHSSTNSIQDHIFTVTQNRLETDLEKIISELAACTTAGAQGIDCSNDLLKVWARGKFSENNHCGYVLREIISERTFPYHLKMTILGIPQDLPTEGVTLVKSTAILLGSSKTVAKDFVQEIDLNVPEANLVLYVKMEFSSSNLVKPYYIALPVHLIREGFRSVALTGADSRTCLLVAITINYDL